MGATTVPTARLEDEAITIIREVAAECERPVLLFSGGKDSVVVLHLAQRAYRVAGLRRGLTGRADAQVGTARDQRIPAPAQHFCGDPQPGTRALCVELGDQRREPRGPDDVVVGDAQLRFPALGHPLYAALDVHRGAQQVAPVLEQFLPGRRKARAMAAAVEQLDPEVLLELLHGVGDGGGHAVQLFGGRGEAALAGDRVEHQ